MTRALEAFGEGAADVAVTMIAMVCWLPITCSCVTDRVSDAALQICNDRQTATSMNNTAPLPAAPTSTLPSSTTTPSPGATRASPSSAVVVNGIT